MTKLTTRIISAAFALSICASATFAQNVVAPTPGEDPELGCFVVGLDLNGDGFLALRAGPGTNYPMIGKLENGDAAYLARRCQNRWCYVEDGAIKGKEAKFRGYIYDAWCEFYP